MPHLATPFEYSGSCCKLSMAFLGQAFRNSRQLQHFVLEDVTPTGRKLGTGSFGSVEEVIYQQIICAGKRIHEALLDVENEGVPDMVIRYLEECQLMSSLRHPNITQFLGLCFIPGTQLPLLVMECLETSLDDLLENMPNLPLTLKRSILEDVASGLLYLHKRNHPVLHRDLTARNVLLTSSLTAKITDMGNSRIADMRPGQMARTLSAIPGTLVYMPPEAFDDKHRYGASLDIFSFGHLALFTITQRFPSNLLPSTFYDGGNLQARNEIQRRGQYIVILEALVGHHHPALVELVKECLHNAPEQRPATDDLLARLQRMREEVEGGYGDGAVRLDLAKVKLLKEAKKKDRKIEEMKQQQQRNEAESVEKTRELEAKTRELEDKTRQLETNNMEIARNDHEIARKDREIDSKDQEIAQHNDSVQQLLEELHRRETQLREELESQDVEISKLREKLNEHQQDGAKVPAIQLKWRRGPDMPFRMNPVQSVQVQGTVYVGGGLADRDSTEYKVMAYDTSAGKWSTLPEYSARWFAMTAIDNQLVLVGGYRYDRHSTKMLGAWTADSKKWTYPYLYMTTPRHSCSTVSYKPWLVVAGGWGADGRLSSVEVMNTDTKQWYTGPPTPAAWTEMKTAIVDNTCYFMGGWEGIGYTNKAYSISLPALVSQVNSGSSTDIEIWKEIVELPVKSTAPLSISGSLLAVGGQDKDDKAVSALYLYQPDAGQWIKVTDIPTPRYTCTSIMITDKSLLVAGGKDKHRLATMDMADVLD